MSTDSSDRYSRDDVQCTIADAFDGDQGLGADAATDGETPAGTSLTPEQDDGRPDSCSCDELESDLATLDCWHCFRVEGDR